jgi:hypothetical protein
MLLSEIYRLKSECAPTLCVDPLKPVYFLRDSIFHCNICRQLSQYMTTKITGQKPITGDDRLPSPKILFTAGWER